MTYAAAQRQPMAAAGIARAHVPAFGGHAIPAHRTWSVDSLAMTTDCRKPAVPRRTSVSPP